MDRNHGYGIGTVCIAALLVALASPRAAEGQELNLDRDGLALQGYDPVSYFAAEVPVKGRAELRAEGNASVYWFSSTENRDAFLADPQRYEPEFGGWCAWAMLEGDKVEVDPLSYRTFEGKLLLFYDGFWGDTRAKWVKKSERAGERALYEQARVNWKRLGGQGEEEPL